MASPDIRAGMAMVIAALCAKGESRIDRADKVLKIKSLGGCRYELFLNEGKKREIRRLTAALGAPTIELDRLAVGELELGALPRGEWRRLSDSEVKAALVSGIKELESKRN